MKGTIFVNTTGLVPHSLSASHFTTTPSEGVYKMRRDMKEIIKVDYVYGEKKVSTRYEARLEKKDNEKNRSAIFVVGTKVYDWGRYSEISYEDNYKLMRIDYSDLQTGDFSKLLTMIQKLLDRNMDLTLVDGTKLQIKGLHQNLYEFYDELGRFDYPEELPFEL